MYVKYVKHGQVKGPAKPVADLKQSDILILNSPHLHTDQWLHRSVPPCVILEGTVHEQHQEDFKILIRCS